MSKDFDKVALWHMDWIEDSYNFGISGYGITVAPKELSATEREDCYVQIQDWDELLTAYKELKHRMEGLEK